MHLMTKQLESGIGNQGHAFGNNIHFHSFNNVLSVSIRAKIAVECW